MSFTRKHYEETARIIQRAHVYSSSYPTATAMAEEYVRARRQATRWFMEELSAMFAADNPRFDAERFAKACEPGSGE